MPRCEHGLTSKECYVCASPKRGEPRPEDAERKSLANRLRRIASGEWVLKGDEGWLMRAADLLWPEREGGGE